MRNARLIGSYILKEMKQLKASSSIVGDVRGIGFFIGMEIVENLESREPSTHFAQLIVQRFRDERILMSTEGKYGNVLKFKPPMVFNMEDATRFISVLEKALTEIEAQIIPGSADIPSPRTRISACSTTSSVSSSSWLESSCDDE